MRFAVLFAALLALVACSDELGAVDASLSRTELSGSVRIPLVAQGQDGSMYQLRGATFEISGAAMMTLHDRDSRDHEALVTQLPPGEYSLYLRPGWEIVEIAADGTTRTALANMVSKNPERFVIGQLSDAALKLEFASDQKQLSFGTSSPVRVTTADNGDAL